MILPRGEARRVDAQRSGWSGRWPRLASAIRGVQLLDHRRDATVPPRTAAVGATLRVVRLSSRNAQRASSSRIVWLNAEGE